MVSVVVCSFPALSCEFASVDVSDVLGTVSFFVLNGACRGLCSWMRWFEGIVSKLLTFNGLQHRFNLTKTVRKYPIDPRLQRIGNEFHSGSVPKISNHGDEETGEDMFEHLGEGSVELNRNNFDAFAKQ